MMFHGHHSTVYRFTEPVALGPHLFRLQPRCGAGQILHRFEIRIDPAPVTQTEMLDAEGNRQHGAWFLGRTEHLAIETQFTVETQRINPFDFVPAPAAMVLPMAVDADHAELLSPCLKRCAESAVEQLAGDFSRAGDGSALGYVQDANLWLHRNLAIKPRASGEPRPPKETLASRTGACRDAAVLLLALCRAVGIPCRFVSGYQDSPPSGARPELHAWVEAWIPGGGWRGFDPTQGLATTDQHIALAASALPKLAAPVSGTFYGDTVAPAPSHRIEIACR